MPTANEAIRDAIIRHQVSLQRLSAGLSQEALGVLDRTEAQLVVEIQEALADGATTATSRGLRKLEHLEDAVRQIRSGTIETIASNMEDSAIDLVRHEAEFTASTLDTHSPTRLDVALPDAATLAALVTSNPFEGNLMSTWFSRLAEQDATRITDAVKVGLVRGLSTQDIVRAAVGTRSLGGADGATQLTRANITSIVRTAVNAYSNTARNAVMLANTDIVEYERYTAVLDSRTTPICRSLDGEIYPVGEGRFPPQHWGCRSIRVAALSAEAIGRRPMKPTTEKMILAEFAKRNGVVAATRADLARGLKGEFDKYARARVRELTGSVAASTTYQQFLRAQPAAFQSEVLGVAKAKLFRDGGLTLDRFVDRRGGELTLAQLATSEREAFARAGIDPDRYRVK